MTSRIIKPFVLALSIFFLLFSTLSAETVTIRGFGKVTVEKAGDAWRADLGKLGRYTLRGTLSPLALEAAATLDDLKNVPGHAAFSKLGLQDIRLSLDPSGLTLRAQADTRKSLKTLCAFLKIDAPFVAITAKIGPKGIALQGDLMFARRAVELELVPKLGTKAKLENLTLRLDVGVEPGDGDDEAGDAPAEPPKKKKLIDLEITPVISITAEVGFQPTKWDPVLATEFEFSYNLLTQEIGAAGSMIGAWKNPLGSSRMLKNPEAIVFENAALEIGWIPGAPAPTKIGVYLERAKFFGLEFGVAVDFSPTSGQVALMAKCKRLSFKDLVAMIEKGFGRKMPNLISGDIAINDVEILFSPNGGKVGVFEIEQGLALKGTAEMTSALAARVAFHANFEEGIGLELEIKSGLKDLVLSGLRRIKKLRPVIRQLENTLDVRSVALRLVATKTEMGGGVRAELLTFGQTKIVTFSGYFNPEKLAQTIIDKVVDFAGDELKKFYDAAGKTAVAAGKKGVEIIGRAGKFLREWALKAVAGVRHSFHGFNKCYNHCVPDYANPMRRHLLKESNAAVRAFYDDTRVELCQVEGDSAAETRQLRMRIIESSWNALVREIEKEWSNLHGDRGVIPFFGRPSNATKGRIKFQGLINESREEHKRQRERMLERLLTEV